MKRRFKKVVLIFITVLSLILVQSVSCFAWVPPKTEDEEKFLAWYDKHKNDADAVYTLSGDLKLTKGTGDDPIRLDGSGKIRIDCGAHGIIANSKVVIDNPNLTINGKYMFVLMTNSDDSQLILKRGTIINEADYACAVQVVRGVLQTSSDPSDWFKIRIKGQDVSGIDHGPREPLILERLDIKVEGTGPVAGIENYYDQKVTLTDCNISVFGEQEAWGVMNQGRTEVNRCRITSSVSDPSGTAISVMGSEVSSTDSKLIPEIIGMKNTVYSIYDIDNLFPAIGRTGSDLKSLLPESAGVYVENAQTKEKSIISVSIKWDLSNVDTTKAGITIVTGRLMTDDLFGVYLNSAGISPKAAVIAVGPEGMFLNDYKILSNSGGSVKGMLELPYPAGADSMVLQYSEDQKNWKTYSKENGNTNILKGETYPEPYGVFGFVFDIPVRGKTFYMRAKVSGDSIFSGLSAVWKIDADHGSSGSSISGESGGDRGGQTVDQEEDQSQREQKRHKSTESTAENRSVKTAVGRKPRKTQKGKTDKSSQRMITSEEENTQEQQKNGDSKETSLSKETGKEEKKTESKEKQRGFIFAAAGCILILGGAVLLGRKFFTP